MYIDIIENFLMNNFGLVLLVMTIPVVIIWLIALIAIIRNYLKK